MLIDYVSKVIKSFKYLYSTNHKLIVPEPVFTQKKLDVHFFSLQILVNSEIYTTFASLF